MDGEPRALHHNKPSELLEASVIPVTITKKVVDALPSIGGLFYKPPGDPNSKLTAQTARLKAQQDLYNQQLATLQAQKALTDEQKKQKTGAGAMTAADARSMTAASAINAEATASNAKLADQQRTIETLKQQLKNQQEGKKTFPNPPPKEPVTPGLPEQ